MNEVLSLAIYDNTDGKIKNYSSPILMQVSSGDGPSSKKVFIVNKDENGNNISDSNEITLTADHNFMDGESVRVFSDNGKLPNGIEHNQIYYVILGSANNKIKLAKSFNTAIAGEEIDIFNKKGGKLEIISYVTDKIPGEPGHPIQYDTEEYSVTRIVDGVASTTTEVGGWYITGSSDATNTIYNGFVGFSTDMDKSKSITTFERKSENRELDNRTYRLRYVIPKEFTNAKEPEKNYVLQESSTVGEDKHFQTLSNLTDNRNTRIIAGITSVQGVPNQTS
ncbi:MAG: tail fiber domain-containing protein, partial [Pseudomonadota bacterium]|nr:tail fiber domain-containing protein [Pseudomonadota bacterium]